MTDEPGGAMAEIRAMLASNPPTGGTFQDRRGRWEDVYTRICPVPEGTRTERMMVASRKIATASPKPTC